MVNPLVSIVITTKNEEKNIENCLKSIKAQIYPNLEIIVVDNNSTDKTKEIALRYTPNVFDFGPERSAQRNYGLIQKAKGEYEMFLDSDMTLSPDLISACIDSIAKSECVALHISEIVLGDKFWSKVRRFERSFYDGTVIDGARFLRRDIFIKVGGFDETMSGPEDWDLDKKLKQLGPIGLVPSAEKFPLLSKEGLGVVKNYSAVIFHNEAEFNLKNYLRKKSYYAGSFAAYIDKWGKNDSDIKKQFSFTYRYFVVFWEKGKWKKIFAHPILSLGMYVLRVSVGFTYLLS